MLDLSAYFLRSRDPKLTKWLILYSLASFATALSWCARTSSSCWWHGRLLCCSLAIERRTCGVHGSLGKGSWAIGSTWALEVQEIDALFAIETLVHWHLRWHLWLFLHLRCVSLIECIKHFLISTFLLHKFSNKESLLELLYRLQCTWQLWLYESLSWSRPLASLSQCLA